LSVGCVGSPLDDEEDCPPVCGASFGLRGIKLAFSDGCIANSKIKFIYYYFANIKLQTVPCSVKLNSGGNSRPLGKILFPSRSSLKNG
jgi:hypothetical protein